MQKEDEIRRAILERVASGCKATELVTDLAVAFKGDVDFLQLSDILDKLIASNEIIEIEYILPDMDYRIKSFYLPKGTKFKFGSATLIQPY
jgi:hypothetical protein